MAKELICAILLVLFTSNIIAQSDNKRIKFKSQVERCLVGGVPQENCIPLSDSEGKFSPSPIGDLLNTLMVESESAIDSIWIENDSLVITFFDAPTIKYKASGLNGIYSVGNNNKQAAVNTILYPTAGGITWRTSGGLANLGMNTLFSCPLVPTASSVNGYALYALPNAVNRSQLATTASGNTWSLGSIGTSFGILDQTFSSAIRFRIEANGVSGALSSSQWLHIQGNGDFVLGQYRDGTRPYSNNFLNLMWTDATGKIEIASKQALMDEIDEEFNITSGQVYLPALAIREGGFVAPVDTNFYLIDLSDNQHVNINVTFQTIGRPYRYIGYKSITGDIDFIITGGDPEKAFLNCNCQTFDGVVGNFSYEVIRYNDDTYIIIEEVSLPLGF